MFEWFEQEISAIKTPRFHLVEGPAEPEMREAAMLSTLQLPRSYKDFVLRFGNVKLYRRPQNNSYRIGVFAGPRKETLDGANVCWVGFHDGANVFIEHVAELAAFCIWEVEQGSKRKAGEDFEEWLASCCDHVRKEYGTQQWTDILRGPNPFTAEEKEVVETRRQIRWRVLGVDTEGDHIFEVTNASARTLSVLTVGVRSKDRRLNGAVLLKIGHIGPTQTDTLHVDCYKDLMSSEEIEVFSLPDPHPEDRDFFAEFTHAFAD